MVGASNLRSSTLASLKMGSSDGGGDRTEGGGRYGSAVNDPWTGGALVRTDPTLSETERVVLWL